MYERRFEAIPKVEDYCIINRSGQVINPETMFLYSTLSLALSHRSLLLCRPDVLLSSFKYIWRRLILLDLSVLFRFLFMVFGFLLAYSYKFFSAFFHFPPLVVQYVQIISQYFI